MPASGVAPGAVGTSGVALPVAGSQAYGTSPQAASGSIGGQHVASGYGTGQHVAPGSLGGQLAPGSIAGQHIAPGSLTGQQHVTPGSLGGQQATPGSLAGPVGSHGQPLAPVSVAGVVGAPGPTTLPVDGSARGGQPKSRVLPVAGAAALIVRRGAGLVAAALACRAATDCREHAATARRGSAARREQRPTSPPPTDHGTAAPAPATHRGADPTHLDAQGAFSGEAEGNRGSRGEAGPHVDPPNEASRVALQGARAAIAEKDLPAAINRAQRSYTDGPNLAARLLLTQIRCMQKDLGRGPCRVEPAAQEAPTEGRAGVPEVRSRSEHGALIVPRPCAGTPPRPKSPGKGKEARVRVVVAVAVLAAVLGPLPVLAAAPVEPGKVSSRPQGEQVAVVPLAPREQKKFILRIQGTGSVLDTLVLPYTLKDWSSLSTQRHSYTTQWHGKDYSPLIIVGTRAELHFPGGPGNGIAVQYRRSALPETQAGRVYALHQQETQSGQLAKLMALTERPRNPSTTPPTPKCSRR